MPFGSTVQSSAELQIRGFETVRITTTMGRKKSVKQPSSGIEPANPEIELNPGDGPAQPESERLPAEANPEPVADAAQAQEEANATNKSEVAVKEVPQEEEDVPGRLFSREVNPLPPAKPTEGLTTGEARVAKLLAGGVRKGKQAAAPIKRLDDKNDLSGSVGRRVSTTTQAASAQASKVDEKFGISNKLRVAAEPIRGINEQYKLLEKAQGAMWGAHAGAKVLGAKAMDTAAGSKAASWMSWGKTKIERTLAATQDNLTAVEKLTDADLPASAAGMSTADLETMHAQFKEFDVDGDGVLSEAEFQACLGVLGEGAGQELMRTLFRAFDRDGSGTIEFSEFVVALSILTGDMAEEKFEFAFNMMDVDGSGFISVNELSDLALTMFRAVQGLQRAGRCPAEKKKIRLHAVAALDACCSLTEEVVRDYAKTFFAFVDNDGSGKISFQAYLTLALALAYRAASMPDTCPAHV